MSLKKTQSNLRYVIYAFFLLPFLIFGCNTDTTPTFTSLPPSPSATPSNASSPTPTSTPTITITPRLTDTPYPTNSSTPTDIPGPAGILLDYQEYAQVEMILPGGVRVLVDVFDPTSLSAPPAGRDILLTTHHHFDHYMETFATSFPGQQLNRQAGRIEQPGISITGIPSAHNSGERLKPEGGTNTIYLIEIGGLRIAHFGDIGQDQLTPDQLDTLLPVDIAITQFTNQFSDMDLENLKGFRLMEQVKPRLIIPTHANRGAIQYALELWPGFYSVQSPLLITVDQLPEQTSLLLLGSHAASYMDIFSLEEWSSAE